MNALQAPWWKLLLLPCVCSHDTYRTTALQCMYIHLMHCQLLKHGAHLCIYPCLNTSFDVCYAISTQMFTEWMKSRYGPFSLCKFYKFTSGGQYSYLICCIAILI